MSKKLDAKVIHVKEELQLRKERQAKYYNRGSRELSKLNIGDTVRVRKSKGEDWQRAVVQSEEGIRSYRVTTEKGNTYRRNRRHIRRLRNQLG